MNFIIVIPARYASSRFPGKPLVKIHGKTMLKRVYEKCCQAVAKKNIIIATDSKKITDHCKKESLNFIMTSKKCLTGTDRVAEVSKKIKKDFYINVQGDEPLIKVEDLKKIINYAKKNPNKIVNAMCRIKNKKDYFNSNIPKLVFDKSKNLIYMSRAAIPSNKKNKFIKSYKQVCIYSFPRKKLKIFSNQKVKTLNEKIEDIEILRFIDLGFKVKMIEVSESSIAVDTKQDLKKVRRIFNNEIN